MLKNVGFKQTYYVKFTITLRLVSPLHIEEGKEIDVFVFKNKCIPN